jgi:very-short-patch-repair endonuclease
LRARKFGVVFRRQQQIGHYIVDFVCFEKKLIIECDGCQHLEQKDDDSARTEFLEEQGYTVIRFWNNEILYAIDGVYLVIENTLKHIC